MDWNHYYLAAKWNVVSAKNGRRRAAIMQNERFAAYIYKIMNKNSREFSIPEVHVKGLGWVQ